MMAGAPPPERLPADGRAMALMLLLSAMWGLNQICIKVAVPGIPPVMQACLRSGIAALLLVAWSRWRGVALFARDGSLVPGLVAGALFATEFGLIHFGMNHTTAARMVVFVYLAPVFTALGLGLAVPGERLRWFQWLGIAVAFGGMVSAFAEGMGSAQSTWRGDLMGAVAALLWALTTILIRTTRLARASAAKTLFYQLAFAGSTLPLASLALGEHAYGPITPLVFVAMFYQAVLVAFASYLTWFWLLTRYRAAQLSVFSFLTPLFGVAFGVLLLDERVSATFVAAALLVGAGIALVNLPGRRSA